MDLDQAQAGHLLELEMGQAGHLLELGLEVWRGLVHVKVIGHLEEPPELVPGMVVG